MNHKLLILVAGAAMLSACSDAGNDRFSQFVDPKIGTGGHGHVFVGANVPFGMVQLGPTSIPEEWDWTSGYHENDSTVIGFSHTHLSGTGIGDLFDITVMPITGDVTYARGTEDDLQSGLWSYADRTKEISRPGYYSVPLLRYDITAELTATARVGFHRYTFPQADDAAIVFDLENGGCWDEPVKTEMTAVGNNRIEGCRWSKGWAGDQRVYFVAEFSKPFDSFTLHGKDDMYGRASFSMEKDEAVLLKVALSPVSIEGARKNLSAELPGWDFDATAQAADKAWNDELSKIVVETEDESAKKVFYTALYHTMIAPSLFCDADGSYYGADHQIHEAGDFTNYTTFSLWDTYRAAMPLMTIIHQEKMPDMINTMLKIYQHQGKLPVWHLWGCETDCMVGNPGIMPVADAVIKGFGGFDHDLAFEAMKNSAMRPDRGQDLRMEYGYIPCDKMLESVAYDMEYAIADASVAAAAEVLGYDEDHEYFLDRSRSYRRYFDPIKDFMRGRDSRGHFRTPFDPFSSEHRADDYCEGNAWQYTWLVPHDLNGLMACFGSKDVFFRKLDSLFVAEPKIAGSNSSPDISGLIGQYAHGNEPSHHILYFYTMAGQPWKTAEKVRQVLTELYHDAPDGLSGNEDVGQMSAWYILSSLGFYQADMTRPYFWFGTPLFDKAGIKVPGGIFTVKAVGNSSENIYIQSVTLNGQPYTKPYIEFKDIVAGNVLEFRMGPDPKIWYCPEDFCQASFLTGTETGYGVSQDAGGRLIPQRPAPEDRLFTSEVIEAEIERVSSMLTNPRLAWMFSNCFPNTLDTTVHYGEDLDGNPDTFVYTGDIPAMWMRDSGAQVWPYVQFADRDPALAKMIAGVIRRQMKCICIDPYANAFNVEPVGAANRTDWPEADPYVFERKWELDSHCYPVRLAYAYWKKTRDTSVFDSTWEEAVGKMLQVMREQQRRDGYGEYRFLRVTDRQLDTKCVVGNGNPARYTGLIASSFRPSDDATTFEFLVPSNFMAVSSLRKASEILSEVCGNDIMAQECLDLASEVETGLRNHAVYDHPEYGQIYAFEVDGYGNKYLMDDANVPSLLAMAYLDESLADDPVYINTRRYVWSGDNPYFFRGMAGEGIGGPHIGVEVIWPMSIMMKAFTSDDDAEIQDCIRQLMITDAGKGFMHESFHKDDASVFTREWFAWQNTLFGELILKIVNEGKVELLNEII